MHFSLQAIGHDPRAAGTPLGIWGGVYAKDQQAQSVNLLTCQAYQKGGLGPFQILEFVLPFPPGLHPGPFWALGIVL